MIKGDFRASVRRTGGSSRAVSLGEASTLSTESRSAVTDIPQGSTRELVRVGAYPLRPEPYECGSPSGRIAWSPKE